MSKYIKYINVLHSVLVLNIFVFHAHSTQLYLTVFMSFIAFILKLRITSFLHLINLPFAADGREGPILPNGDINWACPCHGNMVYGPCGKQYRDFITECILKSNKEQDEELESVSNCLEKHLALEKCITKHPVLYADLQPNAKRENDDTLNNVQHDHEKGNTATEDDTLQRNNKA